MINKVKKLGQLKMIVYIIIYLFIMSVKVAVRVRPFNQREKFLGCLNCIQMKDKTTILINPRDRNQKQHQFTFDYSFWSHDGFEELQNGYLYPIDDRFVDQKKIFKQLGEEIIKNAWNGFNCCLFAYGQTGAGKSYSMIGYETNRGIVPMACEKIFEGIQRTRVRGKKQFQVTISMLEIYNQKVQDLFIHTSKRPPNGLKIRQSKQMGVYVQGITRYQVTSYAQIEKRMQEGAKHRSLASTLMNQYSSRAHTIVMIEFIQKQFITEQKMNKKSSLLNLVDLAGSERVAKTGISDKDRLKQASQINKSLHTLGRVIQHLAQLSSGKSKNVQVPYRQSALTRILQTALGGNSMTTMICAISPANDNYEETLSTLRYADQTKRIKNKPIINQSAVDKIIRQLRQQNERLKQMLRIAKLKGINLQQQDGNIFANIQQIQREIRKNMQSFAINTDEMEDDTSNIMISQFIDLPDPNQFYTGQLDFDTANNISTTTIGNRANAFITNLSQDRLLSFKIKYSCEEQLYVGNKNLKEGGRNRLVLCGLGVQDRHSRLYEMNGKYYIQPLCQQAYEYTLVNGKSIDRRTQIFHNDRIIFGTNSVFLFKNFNQKGKKSQSKNTTGVGSQTINKSGGKLKTDLGVVNNNSSPHVNKKTSGEIAIGTDDLNQSLLLDWQQGQNNNNNSDKKSSNKSIDMAIQQLQQDIDEKLLDYQFAINERQNKMLDTSSLSGYGNISRSNVNGGSNNQIVNKLTEIQKQFQLLKQQNQRKMKQKQQQFIAEIKRMQIQKQVQKAKLKQQLKVKQQQAKKIATQKQRIQKIRDKLLQIEKQRKQKQRQMKQSMLLVDDDHEHEHGAGLNTFVQVPHPTSHNTKKKSSVHIGQVQVNTDNTQTHNSKPQIETKIQYIDRHHFTYDFNVIQNGPSSLPNQDYKSIDPSVNTTSTTNLTNTIVNHDHDQSMLLDHQQFKKIKDISEHLNQIPKPKPPKVLKMESVYNLNEKPAERKIQQAQQVHKQQKRKKSLNLTDILYDVPTRPRKALRQASRKSSDQQNLLNITNGQALSNYIPSDVIEQKQGNQNISLNFSQDMTTQFTMRQQQLLEQIRQYELKLQNLQEASKQKKQSIKNIRKSFAVEFGQNINSDNFYNEQHLFEGQLDFSVIQTKKADLSEENQIQKKKKNNIIQCQNQNIINQRALQVRKRKRQAEQLKDTFIKKQKRQLQKKLVQLIPMLQKFNLWARQMNRNLQGKVQIEYHNFTNYQIIDALKSSMHGKINIQIKIYNFEEGRVYKWPIQVFENRYEIAQNLFQRFLQNSSGDMFADKSKDPFWDPRDFQPYAIGYLSLEPLSYQLDYQGQISLVYKGHIVGYLDIVIEPAVQRGVSKLKQKLAVETNLNQNQIYDPRQLLQKDICFTISIERFRPTQHLPIDKIQKYYISYDILQDNYKTQSYKTQQLNITKQKIGYMLKHSMHNVTQHTLAYLADSPLCITLNLLFQYDNQMSHLSSSFYQHSQSSLNMSTMSEKILKSQAGNTSGQSPPAFSKKRTTIIMQNPDILTKIQKQYSSQQKKNRERAQTISNTQKKKQKEKNKDQCTVF